jgi:transmembrane sensor
MSNVVQLPNRDAVDAQAAQWIARLDRGLSRDEEQQLQDWLTEKEAHRRALLAMAELWDKMDDLSRLASLFEHPTKRPRSRHYIRSFSAIAASFVIICAVFLATFIGLTEPKVNEQATYYQTAIGDQSVVELPDSSRLTLNTNTSVKVEFSRDRRLLILERGEIHIEVAHDKSRPLSVLVQDKIIEAVGTAFNVRVASQKEVEVIVTDGIVRVGQGLSKGAHIQVAQQFAEQAQSAQSLVKGEKLVLGTKKPAVEKIEESGLSVQLSWRDGNLVFRGETLSDALIEISRYTDTSFEIADAQLRDVRIAGLFKAGDVNGLLAALKQNFHIEHERMDNKIVLSAAQ